MQCSPRGYCCTWALTAALAARREVEGLPDGQAGDVLILLAYDAFVAMVHSACNVVHHIMVQPLFLAVLEVGSAAAATILQDAWQLQ